LGEIPPESDGTATLEVAAGTLLYAEIGVSSGVGPWRVNLRADDPVAGAKPESRKALPPIGATSRAVAGSGRAEFERPQTDLVPGEALVRFRHRDRALAFLRRRGARLAAPLPGPVARLRLDVPAGLTARDAIRATLARIQALRRCTDVEYVEPNTLRQPAREPDDTYYDLQWSYDMIDLPRAWDITTGSDAIVVAVVDTGQTNHPDLAGRQIAGYDLISSASIAGDGDGIDSDPTDEGDLAMGSRSSFHGTHVAGTIGAVTNNGKGVAGVTWNTRIMHVRALGRGGGTDYDVANAILYAAGLENSSGHVASPRAHVINMSLGGPGFSQTLADACDAARDAGVTLVAAAGNENTTAPSYPAAYESVISVMAVDATRARAPYSNHGSTVDLAAPGGDLSADRTADGYADGVLSTLYDDSSSPAQPIYAFYQRTSMACPHVAGVAALVLSLDSTLTPAQLRSVLTRTADDLGASGRDDVFGYGLVNAYRAVRDVRGPLPPQPPALSIRPDVLNFGAGESVLDVDVSNHGGGLLEVGPATVSTDDLGAWLTADLGGVAEASRTASRLRVHVDRTGLLTGTFLGRVRLLSNGGEAEIRVVMSVASQRPPPPNLDVFVLALRADTGEEVRRTSVNPSGNVTFSFPTLPIGDYVFVAGTDVDGDGEIGEAGDYFGTWPLLGQPTVVTVLERGVVEHVDFPVTFNAPLPSDG
ncbi:MAG: S8 family serine peptidase, partial [Planctomycetota bacterium]